MMEFKIFGSLIEFNDEIQYYDYYIQNGAGILMKVNFTKILQGIADETIPLNDELKNWLLLLKRWIIEAPRKRKYREFYIKNPTIINLEGEYFFQNDENGNEIIDALENSGKFAGKLLKELFCTDEMPDTSYRIKDRTKEPIKIIFGKEVK